MAIDPSTDPRGGGAAGRRRQHGGDQADRRQVSAVAAPITPEQRFYYLEIPGLEPKTGTSHHESAFYFILDCSQRFAIDDFYLSEQDAQMIAKHLRAGNKTKAEKELAKIWWRVAVEAVGQRFKETVDIRKEAIEIDHILPLILRPIITKGLQWLVRALGPIVVKMIVDRLFKEFIKYADDPQDGVTFKLLWRTVGRHRRDLPLLELAERLGRGLPQSVHGLHGESREQPAGAGDPGGVSP